MAAGDILSVEIGADGWYADITIEGLGTGGTYDLGLGANNVIEGASPKLVFTVTSLGFDDTGAATTIQRTVYGTKQVRKPYPDQATNQETVSGSDVIVRVALSDYVYAKDKAGVGNSGTDVSVVILSGFYTESATPNNGYSGTVTNSSTIAYQKAVANWSWPGYQLMDSTSKLRCVAFERHGQSGRPVRCVKFSVSDGTTTNTEIVTTPTIDATIGDAVPVIEYITATDLTSGLTQEANLTINLIAYPWVGDVVLDTSDGVNTHPTPLYAPQYGICDRLGTYGQTVVVVDSVSGNDTTGVAVDLASFDSGSPPAAVLTIGRAFQAISQYNNANRGGRNNCGGGIIYLKAGNHTWMGSSRTVGTSPEPYAWCIIKPFPGVARADVVINARSDGLVGTTTKVKTEGITIANNTGTTFQSFTYHWVDQCEINQTGSNALFYNCNLYHTRNLFTSCTHKLGPYAGSATVAQLLCRGNTVNGGTSGGDTRTLLGNVINSVNGLFSNLATYRTGSGTIIAFNKFMAMDDGVNPVLDLFGAEANTWGAAIVQNLTEGANNTLLVRICADGSTNNNVNNIIIWHNTTAGQRWNLGYNDTGSAAANRWLWSMKNNVWEDLAIKADTFGTGNGARIGNWPLLFGVGSSGNVNGEVTNMGSGGTFLFEGVGLSSYQPTGSGNPPTCTPSAIGFMEFTDRQAYTGSAGSGNGDYTLQGTSPAIGMPIDFLLAYDLAGNERYEGDATGAYTFGTPPVQGGSNPNWWITGFRLWRRR